MITDELYNDISAYFKNKLMLFLINSNLDTKGQKELVKMFNEVFDEGKNSKDKQNHSSILNHIKDKKLK